MRLRLWLVCMCCLLASVAAAQRYTFMRYSLQEGLVQSQVRCIHQDAAGFIWAGTLGGLSRFDGRQFVNFDRNDGLPDNQINCITSMPDGTLLAGLNGYLVALNGLGLRAFPLPEGFSTSSVNDARVKPDGKSAWLATDNGLLEWTGDEVVRSNLSALSEVHLRSFCTLANGTFLIVGRSAVYTTDGQVYWRPQNDAITLLDGVQAADGSVWLATKGEGIVQVDVNGLRGQLSEESGLPSSTMVCLAADQRGDVWAGSRFGFAHIAGGRVQSFAARNGLQSEDIRDVLIDREGNAWLASYGSGLLRFTGEAFAAFTKEDGLSSNAIMTIAEDAQGTFWMGTYDAGICYLRGDSIYKTDMSAFYGNNRVWSSAITGDGKVWFGTSEGLFTVNNGKPQGPLFVDSIPDALVLSLYASESKLWVGTAKGPCYVEDGVLHRLPLPEELKTRVRCIREDRTGTLWMATVRGVARWDGTGWVFFSEKDGLKDNSTYSIEVDGLNRIWVGTQNGLALYEGNGFRSLRLGETSAANSVNFLRYVDGVLWIGTNEGLYSASIDDRSSLNDLHFRRYVDDDGLRSLETNLNAVCLARDGKLWFGTTEGAMVLDRSALTDLHAALPPMLSLTNLQINLKNQVWQELWSKLSVSTGLPIDPVFDYKKNHLTFYFTGISTTHPEEVEYQFYLEGFEDDWQAPTKANFTTYSNLPYASFVFHVRSRVSAGAWSEEVVYPFSVRPPFWLRWWFIALEALAVVALVALFVNYRRRIRNERLAKDQFDLRSRLLALEQQSLNSSMNRHFIFNALNSIQYYINRSDKLAANRYLTDFARLIRKNLDNSAENMATLKEEVERLELYLRLEHMRFKDKFEYSITVDPALQQERIKVPAMLVQPFLENSIWHGLLPKEGQGRVDVRVDLEDEHLVWTIRDNGIGIENSLKNKPGTDEHISRGMEITNSRIELIKKMTGAKVELHGPTQVTAADGSSQGTEVKIILPNHFHELF